MLEAAVVISHSGRPLLWHLPPHRSEVKIPDQPDLFYFIDENIDDIAGVAHSHPGMGFKSCNPSWEDITTFQAIEEGVGRRLLWWITTPDWFNLVQWKGPDIYDYGVKGASCKRYEGPQWLTELRRLSGYFE